MTNYVRRAAGTPLTEIEIEQLRTLAKLPDDQIDFSDIPESTPDQLRRARHRQHPLQAAENAPANLDKAS